LRGKQASCELFKERFAFYRATNMSGKGDGQWLLKKRKSKRATVAEADKRGRRSRGAVRAKRVAAKKVAAVARAKGEVNPAAGNPAAKGAETHGCAFTTQYLGQRIGW